MLRIVGLQRSNNPDEEFVLLQNQGNMRYVLRGSALMSESALEGKDLEDSIFVFQDGEAIAAGLFVLLTTGCGVPAWSKTRDGALVFHTYMNRSSAIWMACRCPIHVMNPQHSYTERSHRAEFVSAR